MGCVWAAAPQGGLGGLSRVGVAGGGSQVAGPAQGVYEKQAPMGVWQHQGDALHWGLRGGRASSCCTSPQFMQKKSPLYVLLKEDTVWSMEHLNRYINDKFHKTKGLPRDWVFTTFTVCVCPAHSARGGDEGQDWGGGSWATGRSLGRAASGCAPSSWL